MKYVICDQDTLRSACIENRWFTLGGNWSYGRMFEANADPERFSIVHIVAIIWACSDAEYDDIYLACCKLMTDYRLLQEDEIDG